MMRKSKIASRNWEAIPLCRNCANRKEKGSAFADFRLHPNGFMQPMDNFIGDGKSQSAAGRIVYFTFVKAFKNMRQIVRRNTASGVIDTNRCLTVFCCGVEQNAAAFFDEFECIIQ